MQIPVTTLAATIMGLLFLVLTIRVIRERQISDQSEKSKTRIERRVRGHANFAEYTPMILILLGLAEAAGVHSLIVWAGAALLVVGRLLHGFTFAFTDHNPFGRGVGTLLTIVSLLVVTLANGWLLIAN